MIRAALHLSSYPPQTLLVSWASLSLSHWLSQSLSSPLWTSLRGVLGSAPFVVGISISELDRGYQSEAGVGKAQPQKQWRGAGKWAVCFLNAGTIWMKTGGACILLHRLCLEAKTRDGEIKIFTTSGPDSFISTAIDSHQTLCKYEWCRVITLVIPWLFTRGSQRIYPIGFRDPPSFSSSLVMRLTFVLLSEISWSWLMYCHESWCRYSWMICNDTVLPLRTNTTAIIWKWTSNNQTSLIMSVWICPREVRNRFVTFEHI